MREYITIIIYQETTVGGCYVAHHPELPTVLSQGDTPAEAEQGLIEATTLTVVHLIANGLPVPEPLSWSALNNITIDCEGNNVSGNNQDYH